MNKTSRIILTTVGTLIIGSASGLLTADAIGTWYAALQKPSFNPPNWVFGPAWTILYILMGIGMGLIWTSTAPANSIRNAWIIYGVQLGLNVLWTLIFFGLRQPTWALVEIVLLWLAIVWTIRTFLPIHRAAGYLLIPYLLWVSFASLLNGAIVALN
jgi:tryptophan-rich sensory protein